MAERRNDGGDWDAAELHQAAARWHELLQREPARTIVDEFENWRTADPRHAEALTNVERAVAWTPLLAKSPDLQALRQETLARVGARSVRPAWQWRAAAAALVVLLVAGGMFAAMRGMLGTGPAPMVADATRVYQTGVGERMAVTLSDGSNVTLNARSTVRVRYTAKIRELALLNGQALFQVAKNPERPFIVTAQHRSVTALGTEFDVRLADDGMRVALLEGAVAVRDGARLVAKMKPSEVLNISGSAMSLGHYPDMRRFISWKDGLLMFADTPLKDAVAELNSYAAKPIVLGDDRVGTIRVSGTYKATESRDFLEAIGLLFPVKVEAESSKNITIYYEK